MKIKNIIKTAVISALCSTAIIAMADPSASWKKFEHFGSSLETVDSVVNALDEGAVVSAAVDLSQCTRLDGGAQSQTKGGLMVSPYRVQADGTLSFSDSHFTVSTRSGTPTPIMQFLRYTVAPEGAITVTSFIFSVPDYTLNNQVAFDCAINHGVSFHAAF